MLKEKISKTKKRPLAFNGARCSDIELGFLAVAIPFFRNQKNKNKKTQVLNENSLKLNPFPRESDRFLEAQKGKMGKFEAKTLCVFNKDVKCALDFRRVSTANFIA